MTTYNEVFGSATVPPSDNRYVAVSLTANTTFYWPEQATGSSLMADIMEVTPSAAYAMTFPNAKLVSTGRDILVRNIGAYTITLKDNTGGTIGTVAAGEAKYVYLTSNSTTAGVWTIFTFGTGTSAADSSALAGYGLTATGSTLSQSTSTVSSSISTTLAASDRSSLRIFSASGAVTCNLPTAVGLGNGWFACISNQGSGAVTIDPSSTETIDGELTKDLAPGESTYIVTDGSNWVTVGYGRSTQFQFTKLVFPVSAGTPFTLTSAQAANKLLEFTGTLTAAATVNVPAVVAIYYVECSYTGAYALTIKTAAGTGVSLNAGDRSILYCDGTNVTSAQTASVAVANISGGVAGAIVYQTGVGTTGFSVAGTAGHILVSGGTGTPVFGAAATAPAGLTVSGAAFTSRGITDSATATALTIDSGSSVFTLGKSGSTINLFAASGAGNFNIRNTNASANINLDFSTTGTLSLRSHDGATATEQVRVTHTASATNYLTLTGSNGGNPTIGTSSGGLNLASSFEYVQLASNATNYVKVEGRTPSGPPIISTLGGETNIGLTFITKGTGGYAFATDSGGTSPTQAAVLHTASATSYVTLTGSSTATPTIGVSAGTLKLAAEVFIGGDVSIARDYAVPAGGDTNVVAFFSSTASLGVFYGSGAPSVAGANGSIYIRTDGGASTTIYHRRGGAWVATAA